MASIWDVVTGKAERKKLSAAEAERAKQEEADRLAKIQAAKEAKEAAERAAAQKKIDGIQFKSGGSVKGWGKASKGKKARYF
jgi:membrane protein involved in colicin uptake